MPTVLIARHGETDWNRDGRYQGQLESHLTALGRRQAGALANALGRYRVARVISSPLARCLETAGPVARRAGVRLEVDPALIEIAHGTWEGRLREDVEREDGERLRAWRESPDAVQFAGGESLAAVGRRWLGFAGALEADANVAVVTHDVVVRLAILWAGDRPFSQLWQPRVSNGGYAVFETSRSRWQLVEECHETHLQGLLADASRQAL